MKSPKFLNSLFSKIRKVKLNLYKNRKVLKDRTFNRRLYHFSFTLTIDDSINPQEGTRVISMAVPANSLFEAKNLLEKSVKSKVKINIKSTNELGKDDMIYYNRSKNQLKIDNMLKKYGRR